MVEVLEGYLLNPSQHELPVVKTLVVALGDMGREAPVLIKVMQGYAGVRSLAAKALGKPGMFRLQRRWLPRCGIKRAGRSSSVP